MSRASIRLFPLALSLLATTWFSSSGCRDSASTVTGDKRLAVDLLRAQPRRIELETRQVNFPAASRKILLSGWSKPERNRQLDVGFVWATAREARLAFHVLDVRDLQFVVKLVPFPSVEPQHITILANDQAVATIDPAPEFREYRFVVAAAFLHRGRNTLTFRHAVLSRRPDGRDSRSFAAAYVSLLLGPNCLPLRPRGEILPPRLHSSDETASPSQPLWVTGPAEFSYPLVVPAGGELRYQVALPPDGRQPARFVARLRDGDSWHELAVTSLRRPFLRRRAVHEVSADLSTWSGRSVEVRFAVYPEPCAAPSAVVTIEKAGVLVAEPPG